MAFEHELRGIKPDNNGRMKVIDLVSRFFTWYETMYPKTYDLCQLAFKKLLPYLGNKYIMYLRNSDYEPYKAARLATKIIPKRRHHRKDRAYDKNAETEEEYAARCIVETRTICKRTIQIELNYFRTFLRWCKDEEKYTVGDFPKGFPKSQQKAKAKVVLSLGEIPDLIEHQKEGFQRTLTMLMVQNGLRKTEALKLKKENVDLKNNALIITGKGDKTRVVPIVTEDLHQVLKDTIADKKPGDYLFINPRTMRPYTTVMKSLKSAAVAAGIDKRVYNHLMRHSFVTSAIMSGVPVAAVRELAGHEDIRTTQDYTKLMAEYLQTEAVKISSAISGTKKASKPA
jgi:site-specific recombinase XerD